MLGTIIGDIIGSRFEWNNIKTKRFPLYTDECLFTDDTVMSLAVAKAIMDSNKDLDLLRNMIVETLQTLGRQYPNRGYGGMFSQWLSSKNPRPYHSYGNGAAMRVSPCGFAGSSADEVKQLSKTVTEVTHNHPEGIKGAEATAIAVFMAREGKNSEEIKHHIHEYYYPMGFKLSDIRDTYAFHETCQQTVPQALMAFCESTSFEDAIRNAISLGGDSDTIAAITGGVAEAYYGIPKQIKVKALSYLDETLSAILSDFEVRFHHNLEMNKTITK